MSQLRHTRPGYPIDPERDFTVLGPARAGGSGTHYVSLSEAIPSIQGRTTFTQKPSEAKPPKPKPADWPRCGKVMRLAGEPCARRKGHSVGDCRTAEAVLRDTARRRARYEG